jgi:putative DNA methylase
MPTWSSSLTTRFPSAPELRTESDYHLWFLRLCGILGDPIAAKARIAAADKKGIKLGAAAYGYRPAFKNRLGSGDIRLLQELLGETWGISPTVLDPTAGGGSIPYQSLRLGLPTIANDLNPVASAILRATLELPARSGTSLADDADRWGSILVSRVRDRLLPFFQLPEQSTNNSYLFARTVACPRTGKPVPLSPNWWLSSGDVRVAVRLHTERAGGVLNRVEYEILRGADIDFDPDRGTVAGGDAVSPWDGLAIGGEYIRAEAQAGRMGSDLYAVAIRTHNGRGFRAPVEIDRTCLAAADEEVLRNEARWAAEDVIPSEEFPLGNDNRPIQYGMRLWRDMYSRRQILVHGVFVEEFRRLRMEIAGEHSAATSDAVCTILAFMMPKALRFDSMLSRWHPGNQNIVPAFDRHDFSIKWTYAEFEGARELYPWCLSQVVDAYREVSELMRPADSGPLAESIPWPVPGPVSVTCRNAADLSAISDRSVALVCIDPPYYDNVMYAELADYFYVWEKRTLGLIYPDSFAETLTDKKNEAVANPARFVDMGKRKKGLANADYEAKMAAIFAECNRVLRDDGVLTVMFTHKRAEAWDTLGMGLLEAGFRIETSWPVKTESEQSLHQANKNSAASTIMLVCRKRDQTVADAPYFEDLESEVRAAARDALERFSLAGLSGVDLLLSTYGPALSVISSRWPVYSSEADPITGKSRLLRPEEALDAARAEVVRMQRRRLVGTEAQLDPLTDFALIAWETFKAAEFPFDEARRLALATGGLDVDELARARILEKKAGSVVLLPPEKRVRRGEDDRLPGVRPDATTFAAVIDGVHTVMYVALVDGLPAARALIDRAGLANDARFLACLQGLVNAIPRTRIKAGWVRKEAEILDRLCAAYFPAIQIPPDPEMAEVLDLGL